MPTLEKIVIQNFRNIELQEVCFSPNVNCISGGNGEGKTNLLDAIWYLAMTKSSFSPSDRFNFRHGCNSFAIGGTCRMEDGRQCRISAKVSAEGGDKRFTRDDKPYTKLSEHIGTLPVVMVSPADTAMVSETGEERRKFVNSVISQIDRGYLSAAQQYNRCLLQRNQMLKQPFPDATLLDVFDARLAALAAPIHEARAKFTARMEPLVSEFYGTISGGREQVGVTYRSDLDKGPLEETLKAVRERDLALKFTTAGVHRDDFLFRMDGHPIRRCGSQGQQKSFLVALKFAQYEVMKQSCGFPPMLLLDDLFDKLDMARVRNLLTMVAGSSFGQIFITDSNKVRIRETVDAITSDSAHFETEGGVFTRIDE